MPPANKKSNLTPSQIPPTLQIESPTTSVAPSDNDDAAVQGGDEEEEDEEEVAVVRRNRGTAERVKMKELKNGEANDMVKADRPDSLWVSGVNSTSNPSKTASLGKDVKKTSLKEKIVRQVRTLLPLSFLSFP